MQVFVILSPNLLQGTDYWLVRSYSLCIQPSLLPHLLAVSLSTPSASIPPLPLHPSLIPGQSAMRNLPDHASPECSLLAGITASCGQQPVCQPAIGADGWSPVVAAQVGNILAKSPELTQGSKFLSRKAITFFFAGADLGALM